MPYRYCDIRNNITTVKVLAERVHGSIKHFSAMKTWLEEFLQNAAFPAVVLAFACAPMNDRSQDLAASRITDHRGGVDVTDSFDRFNESGNKVRTGWQAYLQPEVAR